MKHRTRRKIIASAVAFALAISSVQLGMAAEPANATSSKRSSSPKTPPTNNPDQQQASLDVRYAKAGNSEVPDFQKHVIPLLGRLGCNGRACHGSFQGRGGFALSLFGYDFTADHQALLDDASGRVDVDDIDESLILAKPLDADMHEGGKRFDEGSWQHNVLRRWIESGADYRAGEIKPLEKLVITPAEIQFEADDQSIQLQAVAVWEDGTREDVTPLCRFSSNDDSIAEINEAGIVKSGQSGDTHVVVYYDNAVVPLPVMRRVSLGPEAQSSAVTEVASLDHPIDQLVQTKLDKLAIEPSGECSDAEFVRRVSLDITGILPTAGRVRQFLADESPDKRDRLVDELLQSPGYAAWWATRFSDWTGNSEEQLTNVLPIRNVASKLWYQWLRKRLEENVPYDKLVEGIVTAQSRQPNETYRQYCESMTQACEAGNEDLYADRDGLALYWARRNFQKPEERAIGFAYTFLGVRIECAQCHKHPFDQWSKDDFEQFSKLFVPIKANGNGVDPSAKETRDELVADISDGKKLRGGDLRRAVYAAAREGKVVPFGELFVSTRSISPAVKKARERAKKQGRKVAPPRIPTGRIIGQSDDLQLDKDPRQELMQWLRSPENPYFAKAIVNRIWSNYFGVGIVDPSDDMNLANPPSNAALLDYLASGLIENDFDLKWVHRAIATSGTYGRSAETNLSNQNDTVNFSRHIPRRLPAEVVYDSVVLATGSDDQAKRLRTELVDMAVAEGKPRNRNKQDFALEVFGQSIRESNCDCDRSDSPSLLQSIYLRNDSEMYDRIADRDGWVNQACRTLGVAGPSGSSDPKQVAIHRRAVAMQKQMIKRFKQFQQIPPQRKRTAQGKFEKEFKQQAKKFRAYGYEVPPLKQLLADPDSWVSFENQAGTVAPKSLAGQLPGLVEEAYLRTLSRYPDLEEVEIAMQYIGESKTPAGGLESLVWALINTKEFIISH